MYNARERSAFRKLRIKLLFQIFAACGIASEALASDLVTFAQSRDTASAFERIAAGEDVNARASDGTSALHWAAFHDNLDFVERLLAAGADPGAMNDYGSTPLIEAAGNGNDIIITKLLDAGADPNKTNHDGQSPLMIVARSNNLAAARILLERGANVDEVEQWRGQTALMWAAAQNQPGMLALLIEYGADVDAKSVTNNWARQVSAEARRHYRPVGGLTALMFAAREGCMACARALVEAGADVELADPENVTPLFIAIDNLHYDTGKFLLEAGANPNRWDRWGRTPLYAAVDTNSVPAGGYPDRPSTDSTSAEQLIALLLAAGANPNLQIKMTQPYRSIVDDRGCDSMLNQPGPTALLRAAKAFDVDAMKLLIDNGALIELPNDDGTTPLMAAAGYGSVECDTRGPSKRIPQYLDDDVQTRAIAAIQLMLDAGANVNARTRDDRGRGARRGQTALHGAALWGWNDVVRFLVAQGARIDATDAQGMTPVDAALGRAGGNGRGSRIDIFEDTAALLLELCEQREDCRLPESNAGTL